MSNVQDESGSGNSGPNRGPYGRAVIPAAFLELTDAAVENMTPHAISRTAHIVGNALDELVTARERIRALEAFVAALPMFRGAK